MRLFTYNYSKITHSKFIYGVDMKKIVSFICLLILLTCGISVVTGSAFADNINNDASDSATVYLGGMPAGFTLSTNGVYVVGVCDVVTLNGIKSPAKDAGLEVGDLIKKLDGSDVKNVSDIEGAIKDKEMSQIEFLRNGERLETTICPAVDMSGNYKLGVFVKDSVSGIGTVTFIKGNRFASLGHAVINDNREVLEISEGNLFPCNITGVIKGERGFAGELRGAFLRNTPIATITKNLDCGVYGDITEEFNLDDCKKIEIGEAKVGDAKIFSTIEGKTPKEYGISIVKYDSFGETKNFVIKVTDKELLEKTGGIVQGMSGSPIVQNGKLVGAVTHVFINDPTRGFGISIENMINN